jgi:hypothetical protein
MPINIPKSAIMSKGRELSQNFRYPIRNFGELANQIGREDVVVSNQRVKISDLRHDIPNYYYPFVNEQDLANKCSQLYDRLAGLDTWGLHSISSGTESELASKGKEIPAEDIPPFPEKFKNIKHKPREPGAVIETIEKEDVS